MEIEEQENLIYKWRLRIEREIARHRRECVNLPTADEYIYCWAQSVVEASQGIKANRKPGRPPKSNVTIEKEMELLNIDYNSPVDL